LILSIAALGGAPTCARAELPRMAALQPATLRSADQPPAPAGLNIAVRKVRPLPVEAAEIPAKAQWTSDEGFRLAGAKLAFKRRF
jgi:hypothetical protein